jgi:hypothetical protein
VLLLPIAAIVVMSAALLHSDGWTGAALVLGGALLLTLGIGLLSVPAHEEHLATRRSPSHRPWTAPLPRLAALLWVKGSPRRPRS